MQHAATTPGLEAGTRAEVRVAQAWFWDGYYVRRGIDLQHRFGGEVSTVTDLDVLGFAFDASLGGHKRIGEVKTGTNKSTPKPLDRALWMCGLRELVGAQDSEVTTAYPISATVRDICRRMGTTLQHLDDLPAREERLQIGRVADCGSQGDTIALQLKQIQAFAKNDPRLDRAYWFLTSEVWFLDPFDALKRTLGLIREFGPLWPPDSNQDATRAFRWFFAEAVSISTLNLVIIAGEANTMSAQMFKNIATARLASGDVPFYAMRKIAERVDDYVAKLLGSIDAPADVRTSAMGAFLPVPPEYTEPILELISRLASEANLTSQLPRQMDALIFERLVRRRDIAPELTARLGLSDDTERLIRLIAAFLRGQFNVPSAVDKVLTTPIAVPDPVPPGNAETTGATTLFDADGQPASELVTPDAGDVGASSA